MTRSTHGASRSGQPRPPNPWLAAAEIPRALSEMTLLAASAPTLLRVSPHGDGHPVLVIPGLLAGDASTFPLRVLLTELGYDARGWGFGLNRGARAVGNDGERLAALVEKLAFEARRKVSLIGWSLGGLYARLLARRIPERVRQIITLGSPFREDAATNTDWIFELASGTQRYSHSNRSMMAELAAPSNVPSFAIYSRSDGVCSWQGCHDDTTQCRESIEVHGSHCGLGANPSVFFAIADRLAQIEGQWAPFEPSQWANWAFPSSHDS